MLVSISKILPSKKLKEEMLPLTLNKIHLEKLLLSLLKLSFLITLVKFKTDILQFWIATPLTLPSNSKKSPKKLIEEQVKNLKLPLNSLNQVIPV
jgi:hypothetical protein